MQYGYSWTDLTLNSWDPPGPGHLLQQREGESAVARNRAEGEEQQAPWLWKMYENATSLENKVENHIKSPLWIGDMTMEKCQPSTGCRPSDGEIGKSIDNTLRHRLANETWFAGESSAYKCFFSNKTSVYFAGFPGLVWWQSIQLVRL